MDGIPYGLDAYLPKEQRIVYPPVGRCIYCGNTELLSDEHVVPYGLGGRMELPASSCNTCCKLTSAFEQTCLRTMYGPLRLLYGLPTRRKKQRPEFLPLKVKHTAEADWSYVKARQNKYPFLILFPYFTLPTELHPEVFPESTGATVKRLWIRGASPAYAFTQLLRSLSSELGVHAIMPEAQSHIPEFCQMLAKIAHSFAVAQLGLHSFTPFLLPSIVRKELSDRHRFIGSLPKDEAPTDALHELRILPPVENTLTVRIRLLAKLGTPTYLVAVGRAT